jgi:hypothetical protein
MQFKDTEDWRKANDIDILYKTIDVSAYEHSRRMVRHLSRYLSPPAPAPNANLVTALQYPQWTGRRDRRGIPLYVFVIRDLDSKAVAAYEKQGSASTFSQAKTDGKTPPGLLRLFALYENLCNHIFAFCSQLGGREWDGTPVTMSTNIVDVSGVGLKQFWNLKGHMQAASQLATAHYPETLDRESLPFPDHPHAALRLTFPSTCTGIFVSFVRRVWSAATTWRWTEAFSLA